MIDAVLDEMIANQIHLSEQVGELQQREQAGIFTATRSLTTGAYAILDTDGTLFCDVSGGSITVTLPSAVNRSGRVYIVKHTAGTIGGGTSLTVATTGGQTIDGSATYAFSGSNGVARLQSDGSNWYLI